MRVQLRLSLLPVLIFTAASAVWAVPTAVNDSFTTPEDTPVSGGALASTLLQADFEAASSGGITLPTNWDYTDTVPAGTTAYPVDAASVSWRAPAFDKASSSVGVWKVGAMPLQGGGVDGIGAAPGVLTGITGGGGINTVNTYLFRTKFTVTAAQAAIPGGWSARILADDAAIIHINGSDAGRVGWDNFTGGTVTMDSLCEGQGGSETAFTNVPLTVPLVAGENTIAIELHQNANTSSDAGVSISLIPSNADPTQGLTYADDVNGTSRANGANGAQDTAGNPNGAINVVLSRGFGGGGGGSGNFCSGGWRKTLTFPTAGLLRITCDARARALGGLEDNEYAEAIVMLGANRLRPVGSVLDYLVRRAGINPAASPGPNGESDSGWATYVIEAQVTAGTGQVTFGGYATRPSAESFDFDENGTVNFDNIKVELIGSGGSLLDNDTGGTGTVTTLKASDPANGTAIVNTNGTFTYTPALNFNGTDSFTYTATDGTGTSAPATVSFTVTPVNDAPAGVADSYSTVEEQAVTVSAPGVLANDADVDGNAITASVTTQPARGTVSMNPNGGFTYTPNANFSGTESFTYRVSDGTLQSTPVTVTMTVTNTPDAPIAVADSYNTGTGAVLTVSSPTAPPSVAETLIANGAAGAVWKYLDNGSNQGTAWIEPAFNDAAWSSGPGELGYGDGDEMTTVLFGPDANAKFITTYFRHTFQVTDPASLSGYNISVKRDDGIAVYLNGVEVARDLLVADASFDALASNAIDDGANFSRLTLQGNPVLVSGPNTVAVEIHQSSANSTDISMALTFTANRTPAGGVLANDVDPDGDALTATLVSGPARGSLTFNENGTFVYSPVAGYNGVDTFTYTISDGVSTSAVQTATITISAGPNQRPVGVADSYSVAEDALSSRTAATGVLANDTDAEGDALTAVLVSTTRNGVLVLNADGSFTYQPAANYNGPDSFTYRARDTQNSGVITVSLTVTPVNDDPVAVADNYGAEPNTELVISAALGVLKNDTDIDNSAAQLSAFLLTDPQNGVVQLNEDGSFIYKPYPGFGGLDFFDYYVLDGDGSSIPARVNISVNGRPVAMANAYSTPEDNALNVAAPGVVGNDTDPENSALTASVATMPARGTLVLNADGSFLYTPAANYAGADSFTYTVSDGSRVSLPAAVSLTVVPVNDAPVVVAETYSVVIDTPYTANAGAGVLRNDTDVDSPSLTAILVSTTSSGVLALAADGSFTYSPTIGFSGSDTFSYRVTDGSLSSASVVVTLNVAVASNTVAISEIMYNPPGVTGFSEEFIEITNTGSYAIDLTGWKFTNGVNYTFPAGPLLSPGGYRVIPADSAAFAAKYPGVTAVTSTAWGALSSLSGGETIRLENAMGERVDAVIYANEGDWATRRISNVWDAANSGTAAPAPYGNLDTDPGLEWVTSASPALRLGYPGGSSIQVRNMALGNSTGTNWAAATPTPGAPNASVAEANSAPLITGVSHFPAVPGPTEQVVVSASLRDELLTGVTGRVSYRTWLATGQTPAADWTDVAMSDDGLHNDGAANDGNFAAALPAQANGTVVEFYVTSRDAENNTRTWPTPTLDLAGTTLAQNANCLYQVDTQPWTDNRPLYRLIMTGADAYAFDPTRWASSTNVAPNCTMVIRQGQDYDIRYSASVRIRGNSSRNDRPRNWRLDIPADNPWNGRTGFTLNTKYVYSQFLASRLFECGGIPVEKANIVGIQLNGTNNALESNGVRTFGYVVDSLPRGGDVIKEWFPGDSSGNGYDKIRGTARWGVFTLPALNAGGFVGGTTTSGSYAGEGWTKQTNSAANNWTDLHAWSQSINTSTVANFHAVTATTMNHDEWARWWAMCAIINHAETNPANGDDDDYSLYFPSDGRSHIIPHDLDTCFYLQSINLGDENAPANGTIYQATNGAWPQGDNATLPQMDKFYRNPVTGQKYKAALRDYLNTIFTKPRFDAMVDNLLDPVWMGTQFTPSGDTIRSHIKAFMDTRRTTIETFLPTVFTAASTLPVQSGFQRSTSAADLGALGGSIDPARTVRVTVNDAVVTTDPVANTWAAGTAVTLSPGINNFTIKAWDESNVAFETRTLSIWLDTAGTNKSGTLPGSETWTAAGGPYNVTASVTVPSGATLTIQPGASVLMAAGANLTVAAGGRLLAEGTAAAPISISKAPAAASNWGGITINGPNPALVHLSYVHFAGNNSVAVHTQAGANVELDHLTFANTAVGYLSLDASSFLVHSCVFPSSTAGFEPVHGSSGIAAGGRAIVRDCWFGKTQGYNDTIDFTGGNRPGPILHVINCVFTGSDDDILDLDSTDAWVEGNLFMHCHRNGASPDSASGVSGGADNSEYSQVTVIRNLFYDCDNAVTMKQANNQPNGNSAVLLYNTIARITKTGGIDTGSGAVNFDDDNVGGEGKGMYLEGNIITDVENLTRNYVPANSSLVLNNNLLPAGVLPDGSTGSGNTMGDPLLNLALITTPATATEAEVRAALTPRACSPALATGLLGRNKGAIGNAGGILVQTPPAGFWPAAISLPVGPGGSFTPTGQVAWTYGYVTYTWSLDAGPESSATPVATPLSLTGLTAGAHILRVTGINDAGVADASPTVVPFTVLPGAPSVILSEILADDGVNPDVIELRNWGTAPADISGCTLSDAADLPGKYVFGAVSIPAGGYLAVNATALGFSLDRGGETVSLYAPGAVLLDAVTFGPQIPGRSLARTGSAWMLSTPTPGAANTGVCDLGSGSTLRINEWLATNDFIIAGDFLELYNPGTAPVALGGWSLSTNFRALPQEHVISPLTFIPAGGFLLFKADGLPATGADHLSFKISKTHESLTLLSPDGKVVDHAVVLPGTEDRSQGLTPDGSNAMAYYTLPTPGFSNGTNLTAATALRNALRITELMYNPASGRAEYIELRNTGATPLDLTGVTFVNGVTFTFGALILPAGGYTVITSDAAVFAAQFPGVNIAGVYTNRLDNGGEQLRYEIAGYPIGILDFTYNDAWYPLTDGSGASLQIVDDLSAPGTWGDKVSWQPGAASPGSGTAFGVLAGDDQTVISPATASIDGYLFPGTYNTAAIIVSWSTVSGPGTASFTAPANPDTSVSFSAPGTYVLRLTATAPDTTTVSDTITIYVEEAYAAWAARMLPVDQRGAGLDTDGDGLPNHAEFALRLNPLASDAASATTARLVGGHLEMSYRVSAAAAGVHVIPQIGSILTGWSSLVSDVTVTSTGTDVTGAWRTYTARDTRPVSSGPRRYLRLRILCD